VPAASISIKGFKFSPATLSVHPGSTVTWTNDEDSLHTVTAGTPEAPSGLFDSGEIDTGVTFPFTFSETGSYPFFCARHDFMRGEVTVAP
jgi:plastocyanin